MHSRFVSRQQNIAVEDVRFFAYIEAFLEKLDQAKFDSHIGVGSFLIISIIRGADADQNSSQQKHSLID